MSMSVDDMKEMFRALINDHDETVDSEEVAFNPQKIFEIDPVEVEITSTSIPFIRGAYNTLTGRGGVGKSYVALWSVVEYLIDEPERKALIYFSEDFQIEINSRLKALCKFKDVDYIDIAHRIHFFTVENDDKEKFAVPSKDGVLFNNAYLDKMLEFCKEESIDFLVFDPLNRFHSLSENSNDEMVQLVKNVFVRVAVELQAVVLVLHHSSKGIEGDGRSRGASTITDSARLGYNIAKTEVDGKLKLTVIKDNMQISKKCDILTDDAGIFYLPTADGKSHIHTKGWLSGGKPAVESHTYQMPVV